MNRVEDTGLTSEVDSLSIIMAVALYITIEHLTSREKKRRNERERHVVMGNRERATTSAVRIVSDVIHHQAAA
jgi:hypothetical protein